MTRNYGDIYGVAMEIKTKAEADAWLEREVATHAKEWDQPLEQARTTVLRNLGYYSGYYSLEAAQRVHELFGAVHPYLGTPEQRAQLTPDEIFQKGFDLAKKDKA